MDQENDEDRAEPANYRMLWQTVLYRAFQDAVGRCGAASSPGDTEMAQEWFRSESYERDFCKVCELAGLDPEEVRFQLSPQIEEFRQYRMSKRSQLELGV